MNMFAKIVFAAAFALSLASPALAVDCIKGQGVEVKLDLGRNQNGSVKIPESFAIISPNVRRVTEDCVDGQGSVKIPAAPNSNFDEVANAGDAVYHLHMAIKKGMKPEDATALATWLAAQLEKAEPRPKETAATTAQPAGSDDWRGTLFGDGQPKKK